MIPALISLILFFIASVMKAVRLFLRPAEKDFFSPIILLAGGLVLMGMIATRSIGAGFPAITSFFESLVFFSSVIAIVTSVLCAFQKFRFQGFVFFGAAVLSIALLAIASSPAVPRQAQPLIPALRSSWLVLHVTLSFIGESFFAVSFVSSIAYIVSGDKARRRELDRITYTSVGIGYPIYTIGALIFGSIWAHTAWGSWWNWDPKEIWALVTWLSYTLYLHVRLVSGKKGHEMGILPQVICAAGFLFALFTFFGVNFILRGLHSYD